MPDILDDADLFVHRARPQWGLAMPTESGHRKVDFIFQDGTARTFHTDFLHLFEPADKPRDVTERLIARLSARADGKISVPKVAHAEDVPSISDQVRLFHHLFPAGFDDPKYLAKHRGSGDMRRRKSHHLTASLEAREMLTSARIYARLDAGDHQTVVDWMCDVMARSALAPRQAVRDLRAKGARAGIAEAFARLMHDLEGDLFDDFTRWLMALEEALGRPPKWSLATALPALLDPEMYLAVKHASFHREASWMAPSLPFDRVPSAGVYRRLRRMGQALKGTLVEAGLTPRDMLDVTAFVRIVMRPRNMRLVPELPEPS